MKKRYTEEQIIGFLQKFLDAVPIVELSPARLLRSKLLSVAQQIRRYERFDAKRLKELKW